jgi:multiple sugar transport system substrate-binding protein
MSQAKGFTIGRRGLVGGAGAVALAPHARAQQGEPINFIAWSAVVDQVKSHTTAFETRTGIKVNYENHPAAQFRATLIARIVANAPIDVMWMNDAWGPEFVEAGWIAPIDDIPALMRYNAEVDQFCTDYMRYKGRQYGMAYYGDHMAFMYNQEHLERAGIAKPPETWDEVVQQSLKLKQAGVAEFPLLLSLSNDAWLIEMFGAVGYSFGGKFVGADGNAIMADPQRGMVKALKWIQDAIHVHKIVSPGAPTTNEIPGLRAFSSGAHSLGVIPRYRIRSINDAAQSQIPGKARIALMPKGGGHDKHNTIGWMRYFGLRPRARQNKQREEAVVRFVEWFAGTSSGGYTFPKMLILDAGVPYCVKPLDADPEVIAFWDKWAGPGARQIVQTQASLAMPKDTVTPWFGEWNEANGQALQAAFLNRATPEAALKSSADKWNQLKKG